MAGYPLKYYNTSPLAHSFGLRDRRAEGRSSGSLAGMHRKRCSERQRALDG